LSFRSSRDAIRACPARLVAKAFGVALAKVGPLWLKKFQQNLKKSIDILLRVQLKSAPSPVFAGREAGELTTGKNKKNRGK
jgi:hypothetical protein